MTTYEVKMGVPLPPKCPKNGAKKGAFRVALEAMPIGGMIEADDTKTIRTLVSLVSQRLNTTLTVRARPKGKLGIWRTA